MYNGHILPSAYNRSNREDVNIVLEVRDNEHSLMQTCPTDRGNDPTVERVNRERGTESANRTGNGPLHDGQWTLVHNTRRVSRKRDGVIEDG
jgi:hypothetical protein